MCIAGQEVKVFTSKSQEHPCAICRDMEWPRKRKQKTQDGNKEEKAENVFKIRGGIWEFRKNGTDELICRARIEI